MAGICEECPFENVIDVAYGIEERAPQGAPSEGALKMIRLARQALEGVANSVECPGKLQVESTGQVDCPLRELAQHVIRINLFREN